MKTLAVLYVFVITLTGFGIAEFSEGEYHNDTQIGSHRNGKFFPLFTIIRFQNSLCTGTGSFSGTCFTKRECSNLGGLNTGSCASKRGVCCVVQKSCGSTSNVNNTYFTNLNYPSPFNGGTVCTIAVQRCNSDICQLRIDFLDFTLAQPNGDGLCVNDFMTVTGGSSQVPRICGDNSGQHVYVSFNGNANVVITITTSAAVSFNRRWNLKLTQLACSCPTLAPSGCLMYYTGTSGTVQSFNYGTLQNQALSTQGLTGTREMVNLNYGACVRAEAGYCSITWSQTGDQFSFTVTGDVEGLGAVVGTPAGSLTGVNCVSDYVIIPRPLLGTVPMNVDRFCGVGFPSVTTFSKPYVLTVVTNGNELPIPPDDANRGFSLSYTQNLCIPTF